MIISRLQGGLGNQLFQWAIARSLSIKYNCDYKFDLSFYPYQTLRKVEIDKFKGIKIEPVTQSDITKPVEQINDDFNYIDIPYDGSKIIYLNGYWQSEKYFISNMETIRDEISLTEEHINKLKRTPLIDSNNVSLHIRRTDYTTSNGYHPVQSVDYYKKALDVIGDYDYIFVFSDDIEWCKNNLPFNNMVFMECLSNIEDMMLMSMCKNNIIANSSFSWWGAWLNNNPNKKVVAPEKWFGPNGINDSNIVPKSWIKL